MNTVDSSAWLEYFADGQNAQFFAAAIEDTQNLVVPSITLYEVFKRILQQRSEHEALQAIAVMQQGKVVELTASLAISAAKISASLKLPMADSIVLTTAQTFKSTLWTQDADFEGISGVQFVRKEFPK